MNTEMITLMDDRELLEHIAASVDSLRQKGSSGIQQPTDPPYRIVKDMKGFFILYMWALYKKGVFVKADSPEDKEKGAESFKKVMAWLGVPLGEEFKNPEALLNDLLDDPTSLSVFYDIIEIVSKRMKEKERNRIAKNVAQSNAKEKEMQMFKGHK